MEFLVSIVLTLLSVVAASVPMLVFLAFVWWMDRYDREPVWLVLLTFLWGAIGSILVALVAGLILQSFLAAMGGAVMAVTGLDMLPLIDASGAVVVAPLVEEPAKAMFLLFVIFNRHFDNMTDGFVYGAAAGLGFGMTENFMYFTGATSDVIAWGSTVVIRTLYSAVMHATATAVVGASLGFARFRGCLPMLMVSGMGLALAMAIHALWNGLLTLEGFTGGSGFLFMTNLLIFPFEVALAFVVFQLCLLEESWTIRRELGEEAKEGNMPEDHPRIIASWVRRHFSSWVPKGVNHDNYVATATSLAMRKKQVRQMGDAAPDFYRDDVARLRGQLKLILSKTE